MGKKQKVGKERRDHYYQLAKLQGYRARSAFKLIHLAQKHNFFAKCQSLLDLCAAPGGWLQVAKQNMPISSTIVGVDLAAIRPIRGCVTIQADITTARCRSLLKKELEAGNVDVVLHDGAPNVGTSWIHDAYVQNELTLHACKLACEFLKPGGTFVTKVFRSQDYGSLIWVFNQLFQKVNATKPQSSRDQSAEIFVVCSHFLAPSKIDPRFFDPTFAFLNTDSPLGLQNLTATPDGDVVAEDVDPDKSNLLQKTSVREILRARGKKNRGGYEEGDDYSTASALVFFNSSNPAEVITRHNKLTFPSPECDKILASSRTDDEIKSICEDLKVCGRRELTTMMRWRFRVLRDWADEKKKEDDAALAKEPKADKLHAVDGTEFDEAAAEKELEGLVDEEAVMRRKAERKRLAKERKIEWRRKLTAGGFPEGDEIPDLFRADIHGEALERQDEWGVSAVGLIDSEDDNDVYIHAPTETYTTRIGKEGEHEHLAAMEMDLDFNHRMAKLRETKRKTAMAQVPNVALTRRKRVEMERSQELKNFEADLTARARDLMFAKKAEEEKDSDDSDDDDDDVEGEENDKEGGNEEDAEMNGVDGEVEMESDGEVVEAAAKAAALKKRRGATRMAGAEEDEKADEEEEKLKKLKADRWFAHPMFANIGGAKVTTNGAKRRGGEGDGDRESEGCDDEEGMMVNGIRKRARPSSEIIEMAEDEITTLPLCDKKKRQMKRKKDELRQESKKRRKEAREGGAGDMEALGDKDELFEKTPFEEVTVAETIAPKPSSLKPPKDPNELAKIQAVGSLLTKSKKSRIDMIDNAYNRYAFNDEDCLPQWFMDDENKHNKPEVPLPKDLEAEFRRKLREIQERPIRKVLEAKFRKKKRTDQRMARVNKQANIIANSPDMTEPARLHSIRRILGKAKREEQRPKKYLVSRSTGGAKTLRRDIKAPKNAQVKVVDRRLKKDKRAVKIKAKKAKKGFKK